MKNGHQSNQDFTNQKKLIKTFAQDHNIYISKTAATLILKSGDKSIEMKPKSKEYKDMNTNMSYEYYNPVACLMGLFDCYKQPGLI